MRRILVLRGGALGDFIVTLPALAALRQRWPEARIELAGNVTAAALAQARGLLDTVHSQHEARWAELFSRDPLSPSFTAWLCDFDLVISFWPDPDGELAHRFPLHPRQRYLQGSARPLRAPAANHFVEPLVPLGIARPVAPYFRLWPCGTPELTAPPRTRQIVIHPGSGSPRKNWPLQRWRALAAWLAHETPLPLAVVAGPAEPSSLVPESGEEWRDLPLETLVNRLNQGSLFIGHDSGVSHLAAACGATCILLFGPTAPEIWAPPAPSVSLLQAGDDLSHIPLSAVQAAVRAALS